MAAEIASSLDAPLGLIVVRKLGVPRQPELAMGAVVYGNPPIVVRNESVLGMAQVSSAEFATVLDRELAEARRRIDRYMGERKQPPIAGRTVILVDDGIATGASMRAAVMAVRERDPKSIVVAVPVAATSTMNEMRTEVDDVVCLESHRDLGSIGFYYSDFTQVSDADVIEAMSRSDNAAGQ